MSEASRPGATPGLGPLVVVVGLAVAAALGASLLALVVANRVAERNARAAARADSLATEVTTLREQLRRARAGSAAAIDPIDPGQIADLRRHGLADPVAELKADLAKHPELIPYPGVLGGRMGFYAPDEIHVLDGHWVFARFEDGHVGGSMLLEYAVRDGRVTWKRLGALKD